jgi:hypothetical protein
MAAPDAGSASSGVPEAENCSDIRLLLSAYVDNEATAEEIAQAKLHIAVCANCASHLAFLRLTSRVLSQAPEVFPSASLSARIAAATYERPTLAGRVAGWLRPAPVRVGLGAALAAGLAMVLIVPRMGEVDTVQSPSETETGSAVSIPVDKPTTVTAPKVTDSVPQTRSARVADSTQVSGSKPSNPKIAGTGKVPAAKPAVASALPAAVAPKKPSTSTVVVASVPRQGSLKSVRITGSDLPDANQIIRSTRTEPQMDRLGSKRIAANAALKNPGAGSVTISRNGYDRTAAVEQILKPREAVASVVPSVAGNAASGISPLLPESHAVTEREANRSPVVSAAVPAAAIAEATPQRKLQFRVNHPRNTGSESFSTAGLNRGSSGLPSANGRDSSFGFSPAVKAGIVDAPVTGMN